MSENKATEQTPSKRKFMEIPELRHIGLWTGPECLKLGLGDFIKAPKYGLFLGTMWTLVGWLIILLLFWLSMPYLAYPIAIGFAMIAPFIAAGTYEVSRRLETGEPLSWRVVLGTIWQQKGRELGWMALVTGFAFFIWVNYAAITYLLFFGLKEMQFNTFLEALLTTSSGLSFIALGNFVGAIFATIVFSVTVISFPLLMDREVDFATAMTTSVRAVMMNLLPMIVWAVTIGLCFLLAIITFLITLPIILPVLGHATWHMYRKVVASASQPEAERL